MLLLWVPLLIVPLLAVAAAASGPKPELMKGMIYVQPSYHYSNNLKLNLTEMQTDLLELKAHNFSNIGLRVSWGEIMTHWDPLIRKATYDEAMCTKLGAIAAASQAHGMKLIFNVHLADTVPQGIDGAYFVPSKGPDINNVTGGDGSGVWRSHYLDIVVRDTYIEPMLLFHTKFASCFEDHPTAPLFWKHSFESVYLFPQSIPAGAQGKGWINAAVPKFRRWAEATNSSMAHWRARWGEPGLASWEDVQLPMTKDTSPAGKAKAGDFWRFWLLAVLKSGQYGLGIGDIRAALVRGTGGAYDPGVAFKHWKPQNLFGSTDMSHAEVVSAFDLPINATALGYYVNDPTALAAEPANFAAYIESVKDVAPANLPIIDWETGASTYNLTEAEQADWAEDMMRTAAAHGVAGFNWWQWIDWAPVPQAPCPTLANCQLHHFGAHNLDGSPKKVWREVL